MQVILKFGLKFLHPLDRNWIDITVLHRPHHGNLFLHWDRVVLLLLKQLDEDLESQLKAALEEFKATWR